MDETIIRKAIRERMRDEPKHRRRSDARSRDTGWIRRRAIPILLWNAFVAVAVFEIAFSTLMRVETFEIHGLRDLPETTVRDIVSAEIGRRRFGFVPCDRLPLLPTDSIRGRILDEIPKIESVRFERRFPSGFTVVVSERDIIPLFCSVGPCYLPDGDLRAREARFAESSVLEPYVIRILDGSGRAVSIGDEVMGREAFETTLALHREIRSLGIELSRDIRIPSRASGEAVYSTAEGWSIRVSLALPTERTAATLRIMLSRGVSPDDRARLDYLDLRSEGRAFAAFKNDGTEDTPDEPEGSTGGDEEGR